MTDKPAQPRDQATTESDPFEDVDFWGFDEDSTERAATTPVRAPVARAGSISHRRNIATTGAIILHDGPKVRVAAKTTLIYHQGKPHSVSLQLARMEKRKGFIPDWTVLPAQIHLQREEVEALFAYLAEARSTIAELQDTDYLIVKTGGAPNIQGLAALVAQVAQNPEAFRPLTTLVGADQLRALRAVVNLGRFENAKAELQAMVAENPVEAAFQGWFERNEWVFGSEYVEHVQPRRISPDSQIDLMFLAVDGFADIFEIKRPGAPVLVRSTGRNFFQPSPELNAAFGQAVHYLAEARAMSLFNRVRRDIPIYQPRVRLVIGRSADWDDAMLMAFRDLCAAWHQVDVLTYDMVLLRIDRLIQTLSLDLRASAVRGA